MCLSLGEFLGKVRNLSLRDYADGMISELDIAYLGAGRGERLDLYRPEGVGRGELRAGIVVIHGGGWRVGDKRGAREMGMVETLVGVGYVCASINYQMVKEGVEEACWPRCMEDCREAVRWMRRHAAEYGIDAGRIGAIGGSAGGCMSLLLGAEEKEMVDGVSSRVQAVVALYPPTNMLTWGDRVHVFGKSKVTHPELHKEGSPVYRLCGDFSPVLMMHGTKDEVVPHEQSEELAAAMEARGLAHELILVEGAPHTFMLVDKGIDVRGKVVEFFGRELGKRG